MTTDVADPVLASANVSILDLRAMHLPETPGSWPAIPGWWLILTALIIVLLCLLYYWRAAKTNPRHKIIAILTGYFAQWQNTGQSAIYLARTNELIRRIALSRDGRHQVARLEGDSWYQWLADHSEDMLSETTLSALSLQLYQFDIEADVSLVHADLCKWLATSDVLSNE